jgi:hypothetical protein
MKLFLGSIRCKLGKIQFPFSIVHMVLHPPGYRLDVEIPRINGVVAVAIITGFLQDILHIPGNSEVRSHLIPGKGGGNVLGRPDKLDDDQYGD